MILFLLFAHRDTIDKLLSQLATGLSNAKIEKVSVARMELSLDTALDYRVCFVGPGAMEMPSAECRQASEAAIPR